MVRRHISFDGERDTRTPHDFSGNGEGGATGDVGDEDDEGDADDSPGAARKRSDSKTKIKSEGGKMVPVKQDSAATDVSGHGLPPSTSPTLPISSDRHTHGGATSSASRSSLTHWGGGGAPPPKRQRIGIGSGADDRSFAPPTTPGSPYSPYRHELEPSSHHTLQHGYPHLHSAPAQAPIHSGSYHTPYFGVAPPSSASAPQGNYLHSSPSFPPSGSGSSSSTIQPPILRTAGFGPSQSPSQSQSQSQLYSSPTLLRPSHSQPLPRISQQAQPAAPPHSPEDLFAGVFGNTPASASAGSSAGSAGAGVGPDPAFMPMTLTFDWPQLTPAHDPPPEGAGGPSWLDYLTGSAPPAAEGDGRRGGGGASPQTAKRMREEMDGQARDMALGLGIGEERAEGDGDGDGSG